MEIAGEIMMTEAQKACGPLGKRVFGWRRYLWLGTLTLIMVAALATQTVIDILIEGGFGFLAFVLVALGGIPLMTRGIRANQRRSWAKRGVPGASVVTYRQTEEYLILDSPLTETRLRWAGITEIAPGGEAWLFIGQGAAYFIPKRLFTDAALERAFLEGCLARMTVEARGRSIEATALAHGTDKQA